MIRPPLLASRLIPKNLIKDRGAYSSSLNTNLIREARRAPYVVLTTLSRFQKAVGWYGNKIVKWDIHKKNKTFTPPIPPPY